MTCVWLCIDALRSEWGEKKFRGENERNRFSAVNKTIHLNWNQAKTENDNW